VRSPWALLSDSKLGLVEAVPGASARHQLVSVDLSIDVFLGILKCLGTDRQALHLTAVDRLFHDASPCSDIRGWLSGVSGHYIDATT
jgi:hypothetical protein